MTTISPFPLSHQNHHQHITLHIITRFVISSPLIPSPSSVSLPIIIHFSAMNHILWLWRKAAIYTIFNITVVVKLPKHVCVH